MVRVLFVCLGNVCRSPMAEAIFGRLVVQQGLSDRIQVESGGTANWHVGEPTHPGALEQLRARGVPFSGRASQVTLAGLRAASHIIAMDAENVADLRCIGGEATRNGKVRRLLEFAPEGSLSDVPDPYSDGNFGHVYELIESGCRGLLDHIKAEIEAEPAAVASV